MMVNSFPHEIDLDELQLTDILLEINKENASPPVVFISLSVENWEAINSSLCVLRANNLASIIFLKEPNQALNCDELSFAFTSLKKLDQLTIHNFLTLSKPFIPPFFISNIEQEAKLEKKWLTEWLLADTDTRICYYPALPWRSYIRKTINENYKFAMEFLKLIVIDDQNKLKELFLQFLEEKKKKVLCVFPKNWFSSTCPSC